MRAVTFGLTQDAEVPSDNRLNRLQPQAISVSGRSSCLAALKHFPWGTNLLIVSLEANGNRMTVEQVLAMTIRYKCPKCSSVLKIKDQLAGTDGKCPKCKTKFVVPQPDADDQPADAAAEGHGDTEQVEPAASEGPVSAPAEPVAAGKSVESKAASSKASGDDFDVDAFLMDDASPAAKSSAGLASAPAASAGGPAKPPTDRMGRRQIVAPPPSAGGSAASASALELMSKQVGESKVSAAALAQAQRPPLFDWAGLGQQLKSNLAYVIGVPVLVIGLYFTMSWMMTPSIPLPQLARITGSVTLDGKPLPNVMVYLSPVDPVGKSTSGKTLRLRDASGITDQDGFYRAYYIGTSEGVPLGKVRLWVRAVSAADERRIPGQYTMPGTDMREVREAGNENQFNLELKSGSAR